MTTDLHLHTTASDGAWTPGVLVRVAAGSGVGWMSVTDHDTLAGLDEAAAEANRLGIGFTPGVELSVTAGAEAVHLLAYGFDPYDSRLASYVELFRCEREDRAEAMIRRLEVAGVTVDREALAARVGRGVVGRVHLAEAVVSAGGAASVRDAFARYLAKGRPCHVPLPGRDAAGAIERIHGAGGIAALAHPGEWTDHRTVTGLAGCGLDALEVWHPSHDERLTSYYLELAGRLGLVVTGGSDFHGLDEKEVASIGRFSLPEPRAAQLRERLLLARAG